MIATALEALIKIGLMIFGLMTAAAYFVLLERRIAAWVQDRLGPNRVGIPLTNIRVFGLGQPLADGVKFIFKEEYTPAHVDKRLFVLAPISILAAALVVFAVIPFGSVFPAIFQESRNVAADSLAGQTYEPLLEKPTQLVVAPGLDVGMVFIFALSSIAVYGVILGGWASNNKYSFLGGLRSSAQLIAYELPMGLGILGVVLAAGSLNLETIIESQAQTGLWFAFAQPLGFVVFVIAAFAEAARLPFDLPECEQELIGGYHTEYAGLKLLMFLVAEFLHMIMAAFLIVMLFFGGWHFWGLTGPIDDANWFHAIMRILVLFTKVFLVIFFFMLVRWSWPRFRFDQLMALAWKVMLPLGLVNLTAVAVFAELRVMYDPTFDNALLDWAVVIPAWLVCGAAWVVVAYAGNLVTDNRPRRDIHPFEIDPQI